jgi:putrescine transport system substrate-binding protein
VRSSWRGRRRVLEKGNRLMFSVRRVAILILGCSLTLSACGDRKSGSNTPSGAADTAHAAADTGKVLNLYIWSDYLAPETLSNFEKQTGIKVHVAYFDTNETLETKLLAGSSGYDVVVPTASYFERQIKAGVYLTLDKSKLPNLKNMDAQLMSKVALHDPGNAHGIIYTWGTNGIGFNEKMVKELMPDAPLDSWRMVFDPTVASKVAKCGISVLDSPAEMLRAVYSYLGKDPNSQSPDDLRLAEATLTKIRPYIRNINSSEYIEALANGDLCIAVGYNGDVMQARDRAREANKGIEIKYIVPKEGSILWFDMLAIPKDAPDPDSAYAYLNYIMTPQVIADITNFKRYANANAASDPLVLASVKDDPGIYPPPEQRQKLAVQLADSPDQTRAITRVWQKFKTGQ